MIKTFDKTRRARVLRGMALASLVAATGLLAGCDKQPTGQVVAVVNGEEVTSQELNAELGGAELGEGASADETRNRALDSLINRRLLAGVARDEQIASSPEFIIRRRQMEDALLVQMLSQKIARELAEPTAAELDKFIADNPQMFANRTILALDQIRFEKPARDDYVQQLAATKTMAEVVAVLNRLGIRFQRANVQVDSASMPAGMFSQVMQVGGREPFVVPGPAVVSVSNLLGSRQAPIAGDQARTVATNALRQRSVASELEKRLGAAKTEGGVDYQPGFGPPPETAVPNAAASAAPGSTTPGAAAPTPAPSAQP